MACSGVSRTQLLSSSLLRRLRRLALFGGLALLDTRPRYLPVHPRFMDCLPLPGAVPHALDLYFLHSAELCWRLGLRLGTVDLGAPRPYCICRGAIPSEPEEDYPVFCSVDLTQILHIRQCAFQCGAFPGVVLVALRLWPLFLPSAP